MIIYNSYSEIPETIQESFGKANVFFCRHYYDYLIRDGGSKVVYLTDNRFIMPVRLHRTMKFFRSASIISEPYQICDQMDPDYTGFLDNCMETLRNEYKTDWLQITPASSLFKAFPREGKRIGFGNYVINLEKPEDELFQNMSGKHRNMVRRGEKANLKIRFGGLELLDDYMLLDQQVWKRNGKKVNNQEVYANLLSLLAENSLIGIAYKEEEPQCGILGIYNQTMFYYLYGASADKPEPGSTHYLQWKMIQIMKEKGTKRYNFVGCRLNVDRDSKYYNIQHFKEGFGGELVRCYLFKHTYNRFKREIYEIAYKTKFGEQYSDIIDQEIHKWEELN